VISAQFAGDKAAQDRLEARGDAAQSAIGRAIVKLGNDLKSNVQQKLSGEVLQVRSGALREGIAVRIEESGAAVKTTVYSDARYAAAQEFGFTGTVSVRASLRRIKSAFGRPIAATTIGVATFSRRMNLPQRSFLRSALDDMATDIGQQIGDAVREALA